ncbi:hypothetical protein [Metabacillus fastidiosus]|uniref:hypothetical protein n=1 Tax=Metabacillus fastidiosus TaxID=1458 RepID=UPI003D2C6BF7
MTQQTFINSDKKLEKIIKSLQLNISMSNHDYLVCELYQHIKYTRRIAYKNGYDQGRFDEYADALHKSDSE